MTIKTRTIKFNDREIEIDCTADIKKRLERTFNVLSNALRESHDNTIKRMSKGKIIGWHRYFFGTNLNKNGKRMSLRLMKKRIKRYRKSWLNNKGNPHNKNI